MSRYENSGDSRQSENAEYGPLSDMSHKFDDAHKVMEQVRANLIRIAGRMESEHALVGQAGTEFVTLIRGPWINAVQVIDAKMIELAQDVKKAMARFDQAESQAAAKVND